ncbi:MAG TPA: polysaccharide biosynthesis/export family protein [Blastocatellia bacterium]|nr:polysaccharide biosynthesis/export family protein [Blastocatellia bacterium]
MMTSKFLTPVLTLALITASVFSGSMAQNRPTLRTPARYQVQAGDVLEVQYRYTPEFNDTVTVQPDGFVTLPLIGDLAVGGLTLDQVRVAILHKAEVKLNEPELNIKLREFERPTISVFGEVERPGRIELHGSLTAMEALAAAGGFKPSAKHSQVVLFRKLDAKWAESRELNLGRSLSDRNLTEDLDLRPGDLLYVPKNRLSKVEPITKIASLSYPLSILLRR